MKRVIIDTDPGVDDALALMLAFGSPELRVEAVTAVVGNVSLRLTVQNSLRMLEFLGVSDVPVAAGAAKPLIREASDASGIHGGTGMGEALLPEPRTAPDSRAAAQLIIEKAEELGKELTIVPIGPLTNIASAILARPGIVDEIAGLVIMGGAYNLTPYGHGNVNPVAEFNIWHDPEAAKIVFNSGIPIRAVGLDVTTDPANRLSREAFEAIDELGTRRAKLVSDLCRDLVRRRGSLSLHDPLTVAATVDPSIVGMGRFKVDVETAGELTRGMTLVERRHSHPVTGGETNVEVCLSVDSGRFLEMFMERVVGGVG
jgi:inosine-uridine nucleoside N-ribohydrolase